jgi:hypothetical protein
MWYGKYHSFIQANLQHSIAASRVFTTTVVIKGLDKSLIQEPWYGKGHIMGLSILCFTLFFVSGIDRLEHASLLWGFSCRDLVAVQINYNEGESERRLVVCSAYLPCDSEDPPLTREFEELLVLLWRGKPLFIHRVQLQCKPYCVG